MRRWILVPLALAVLLAAGCSDRSSRAVKSPAEQKEVAVGPVQPAPGSDTTSDTPEKPADPTAASEDHAAPPNDQPALADEKPDSVANLSHLVTPVPPGVMEPLRIPAGEPIGRPGLFFMQAETGTVEGWPTPDPPNAYSGSTLSPDYRWLAVTGAALTFLVDRKTGARYQWESSRARLVTAWGDRLLFQALERLWLMDVSGPTYTALAMAPGERQLTESQVVFSTDGQALMLLVDRHLYLVQTDTGAVQEIGDESPPEPGADDDTARLEPVRRGAEVAVVSESRFHDPLRRNVVRVRRYSWQGERLAEGFVPAWGGWSPDGKLAFWVEPLEPATSAVTIASGDDLTPRVRIKGATACTGGSRGSDCWLADGSGLVVRVRGGYRILRHDGTLAESPALARADAQNTPLPAPNRLDRFAIGCTVVDAGGRTLSAPVPRAEGEPWIGMGCGPWDSAGREIRVGLYTTGKDSSSLWLPLDPLLERPPFPATVTLGVHVPANDCVNLRLGYGLEAPVLRCLPDGTRLAPTTPPGRIGKGWIDVRQLVPTDFNDTWWLHVRTEQGERGWVAYSSEWLAWAPPPEDGSLPSDALTASIEDAVANMQHWLQVALGEKVCGDWCGQASTGDVAMGLINQCQQRGPDRFRRGDGYDPNQHGPSVDGMEQACTILVATQDRLGGYPADTPEWRQSLLDALAWLGTNHQMPAPGFIRHPLADQRGFTLTEPATALPLVQDELPVAGRFADTRWMYRGVTVILFNPAGRELDHFNFEVDDEGSFAGTVTMPDEAGTYRVEIHAPVLRDRGDNLRGLR